MSGGRGMTVFGVIPLCQKVWPSGVSHSRTASRRAEPSERGNCPEHGAGAEVVFRPPGTPAGGPAELRPRSRRHWLYRRSPGIPWGCARPARLSSSPTGGNPALGVFFQQTRYPLEELAGRSDRLGEKASRIVAQIEDQPRRCFCLMAWSGGFRSICHSLAEARNAKLGKLCSGQMVPGDVFHRDRSPGQSDIPGRLLAGSRMVRVTFVSGQAPKSVLPPGSGRDPVDVCDR